MLAGLRPQPADQILQLIGAFAADPRPGKIDLGVGVYRDAAAVTPIMRAVRVAGERLARTEVTKTYTQLAGDPAFGAAMADLILGPGADPARRALVATPGGSGALRQAYELVRLAAPAATVWRPDPTWPNHTAVLDYLGFDHRPYRYLDHHTQGVDLPGLLADLAQMRKGDIVLLHGCCHNPTGANLNLPEWAEVAATLDRTGAVPLIDLAYQGFGDGLEVDAAPTRLLAERLPELLIAASCSKNFGIYRERTGILMALGQPAGRAVTQANLESLNRLNFSFPPDHGARIVTTILGDSTLRADWQAELDAIRAGMLALRRQLADTLRDLSGSDRFGYLAGHRGMFSRLPATPEQVRLLREEHAIYLVGDGRINIAGLTPATVPTLASAMMASGL